MRKYWLLFSQFVTLLVALGFVISVFKPYWLNSNEGVVHAPSLVPKPAQSSLSLAQAAQLASRSVVSITANVIDKKADGTPADPWRRFFNDNEAAPADENQATNPEDENDSEEGGLGSGVIVDASGMILTNNHVIENANDIQVQLSDGRSAQASIVGTDPDSDLAVLKINLPNLPVATWGNPKHLQVGDPVLAIGNPFNVGLTVTSGIVSALGRDHLGLSTFENFIQTDAAINPGNSGGALVNERGELIGINTAIYSRSGGSLGIGFAISAESATHVLKSIQRDGKVRRGWMGVEPSDITEMMAESLKLPYRGGVLLKGVIRSGPASKAGLQPGDFLLSIDQHAITNTTKLLDVVAQLPPGKEVAITVLRSGEKITIPVRIEERPSAAPQPKPLKPSEEE